MTTTMPPWVRSSATSRSAALAQYGAPAAKGRADVLAVIAAFGPVTDMRIGELANMSGDTVRPRRGELAKAGLIRRHEVDGVSPGGRPAARWVLATEPEQLTLGVTS